MLNKSLYLINVPTLSQIQVIAIALASHMFWAFFMSAFGSLLNRLITIDDFFYAKNNGA